MKVKEIMERAGTHETGRAIAYIKDGLEEMNLISAENINRGTVVSTEGTGISFQRGLVEHFAYGNFNYTSTLPASLTNDGWAKYTAAGASNWEVKAEDQKIVVKSIDSSIATYGLKKSFVTTPGQSYYIFYKMKLFDALPFSIEVSNTNSTTYDFSSNITRQISIGFATAGVTTIGTHYQFDRFTATGSTTTMYTKFGSAGAGDIFNIDYIKILPAKDAAHNLTAIGNSAIYDSNGGFGSFTKDMKILVDGSSSNDSSTVSTFAPYGYYNIVDANANRLILNDVSQDFSSNSVTAGDVGDLEYETYAVNNEAAGAKIKVRGQDQSYSDIAKDKRFYTLPDDYVKIKDVKVKNHLNTDGQWRSIPRMIGTPVNTDKDGV